jgi:hypothetical protein
MTKDGYDTEKTSINKKAIMESLDKRWHKPIVDLAKEQVGGMETPEEWSDILQAWRFFGRPAKHIIETLNMFARFPAASAYYLAIQYMFIKGLDDEEMTEQDIQALTQRFRRTIWQLYGAELLRAIHIKPEETGPGRRTVTIWLAPFAKDKDIEKVKTLYLNMGGVIGRTPKDPSKTPREVAEYNVKVKIETALLRYKKQSRFYDHYVCPKKHPEGTKAIKKQPKRYKTKMSPNKCLKCGRLLNKIPIDVWEPIKRKEMCKEEGIKF